MRALLYYLSFLLGALRLVFLILSLILFVGIGFLLIKLGLINQAHGFFLRTQWCKIAIRILGIQLHVNGNIDLTPGTLYVGNHRSLIDPVIIYSFVKNGYAVSKAEVAKYPIIGLGAQLSGVIFVERSDSGSRKSAKELISKYLKEKLSIVLFPEGTVGVDRLMLPFKKGSFEAAAETNAHVVPFAMELQNPKRDFWIHDHLLIQFLITFSKPKTIINIHFFDPIASSDAMYLTERSQELIQDQLTLFQKSWAEKDLFPGLRNKV